MAALGQFQPTGFQPAGGFGLQMPQIGMQPVLGQAAQYQAQPLQYQPPTIPGFEGYQQPAAGEPTTFTIGIPGGFQFAPDGVSPKAGGYSPSMAQASYSPAASPSYQAASTLRTRDAGLTTKKPKKKTCFCC